MFEWKEDYSVSYEKIDDQHKKLLAIGRELINVMENTSEGFDQFDHLKSLLKELYDYTIYHFNAEEKIMEEHNFLDLPTHRFQHKFFVKKLEEIDIDEFDLNQNDSTLKLLDFVANWIGNHILIEDHKYAPLLSDN